MHRTKNHYIKYSRLELENYTKQPESCVKKINCVEPIRFSPTITTDFKQSILRILCRKIGKFDNKLNGIVLDFRNTKILASQSAIRQDSPFSIINVAADFYVFSPQRGAIVTGTVKYISRTSFETLISVVIYRVFNVKVTVKGKIKYELEKNSDIQIRVKDFNFDNVIPFIEGEIFDMKIIAKGSSKKLFDDVIDSGISESSVNSEAYKDRELAGPSGVEPINIKQERESSVEGHKKHSDGKRKRKRQNSQDDSSPSIKKIKAEPLSTDDELEAFQGVSNTRFMDDTSLESSKKKSHREERVNVTANKSSFSQSTEKKKSKRVKMDTADDFETSLQLLLNSQIKTEN